MLCVLETRLGQRWEDLSWFFLCISDAERNGGERAPWQQCMHASLRLWWLQPWFAAVVLYFWNILMELFLTEQLNFLTNLKYSYKKKKNLLKWLFLKWYIIWNLYCIISTLKVPSDRYAESDKGIVCISSEPKTHNAGMWGSLVLSLVL